MAQARLPAQPIHIMRLTSGPEAVDTRMQTGLKPPKRAMDRGAEAAQAASETPASLARAGGSHLDRKVEMRSWKRMMPAVAP